MPSLKEKKNIAVSSEAEVSEVITPLDVHTGRKTQSRSLYRWLVPAAFFFALVTMVSTGAWFLNYLTNKPLDTEETLQGEDAINRNSTTAETAPDEENLTQPPGPIPESAAAKNQPNQLNDTQDRPNRREALALMAAGRDHESRKALSRAMAAYRQAFDLDPENKETEMAINRVGAQIKNQQYRRALSKGLEALEKADYAQAKNNLLKAASLKPGSRETREALARVDEAVRDLRIKTLNQNARAAEQVENWRAAGEQYADVLKLDPNNELAQLGQKRAHRTNRIFERMQGFLNQPDALNTSTSLEDAATLVGQAQMLNPKGTKFTQSLERLSQRVVAARKPVRLTITSDNQTQVDVYRIGRLGRFSQKELDLKPGVYTVVGYRDGYQDVRQQVTVDPGQENLRVTIICKVKV